MAGSLHIAVRIDDFLRLFATSFGCTFLAIVASGDGGQNLIFYKQGEHIAIPYHFLPEKVESWEMEL